MTRKQFLLGSALLLSSLTWFSCSDNDTGSGAKFDPSQPMAITDFYPDSGGIATPMIISGKNFGSDTTGLAVWYVDEDGVRHKGGLVSSNGEKLYCYVPSGLTYKRDIKLEVTRANGTDTITGTSDRDFKYITQTAVTTIVGRQTSDPHPTKADKLLNSDLSVPSFLCIDPDNNIFVVGHHWNDALGDGYGGNSDITFKRQDGNNGGGNILKCDLKKDQVTMLYETGNKINAPAYSTMEGYEGVYVPLDGGTVYFSLLKHTDYNVKTERFLKPKGYEDQFGDNGNWKYNFVFNKNDKMLYTVMFNGQLVRINPRTRKADVLIKKIGKDFPKGNGGNDACCAFSSIRPNRLFIALADCHQIWYVDVDQLAGKDSLTYQGEPYAGVAAFGKVQWQEGKGWEDGLLKNAKFNYPRQMTFTSDGKLYIADSGNHCIRVIDTTKDPSSATVTTPIGIPGSAGYADGGVDIAKFNWPTGVAVSADGQTVYVADSHNQVIRELSIK